MALMPLSRYATRATMWTDNLRFSLPVFALFGLAGRGPSDDGGDVVTGAVLPIKILASIAPVGLCFLPRHWKRLYTGGERTVWFVVRVCLIGRTRRERGAGIVT